MEIQARDYFRNMITSILEDYPILQKREIVHINEVEELLKIQVLTHSGYTIEQIQDETNYRIVNPIRCQETKFENGLILIDSCISFNDKCGDSNEISQLFVTTGYHKEPLVNLVIKSKDVSLQSLLVPSLDFDSMLNKKEKNIFIEEVTFEYKGMGYTTSVTSYRKGGQLLLEQYQRNNYFDNNYYSVNKALFSLLGSQSEPINFLYHEKGCAVYIDQYGRIPTDEAEALVMSDFDYLFNVVQRSIRQKDTKYKNRIRKKESVS